MFKNFLKKCLHRKETYKITCLAPYPLMRTMWVGRESGKAGKEEIISGKERWEV
jgi:hypothetical protein